MADKAVRIFLVVLCFNSTSYAQNQCGNTSVSLEPMDELLSGTYNDSTGGMYFPQTNTRPAFHDSVGRVRALEVAARDANGLVNWSTGKIGVITIGMSSCQRVSWFLRDTLQSAAIQAVINPRLVFKNCARQGVPADEMADTTVAYWTSIVPDSLTSAGLTSKQVGVVIFHSWLQQASRTWPAMPVSARNYFLRIARIIQNKFPYCKQIFVFSRCYSGYAEVGSLQDEPSTYWQGYAVKWMIGAQTRYSTPVDSVSYLKTRGYSGNAPWFDWLTYNWADGIATGSTARADGLKYACADFEENDGVHEDVGGRRKHVIRFLNKMKTDPTMSPWFLRVGK